MTQYRAAMVLTAIIFGLAITAAYTMPAPACGSCNVEERDESVGFGLRQACENLIGVEDYDPLICVGKICAVFEKQGFDPGELCPSPLPIGPQ